MSDHISHSGRSRPLRGTLRRAKLNQGLIAFILLILLLQAPALRAASQDLTVAREALAVLQAHHWNPHLDMRSLIRSGVSGLRRALQREGIDASSIGEIESGLSEQSTLAAFDERLNQTAQIAGGRIPGRQLLYEGLRAMFHAVGGSHTAFLDPQQRAVFQAILAGTAYGGIGINFEKADERWILSGVIPDGPADRSGMRRGDVVLRIDDRAVDDLESSQIQPLFLGEPGTSVRVTLRRGGSEFTTVIARALVKRPVVESRMLADGIGYVKMYGYSQGSAQMIREALARLLETPPRGLVVDLRENGGGLIREFVDTIRLFVPAGTVVFREFGRDGVERLGKTVGRPIVPALPLIALVDLGTGSNGELTAAALKEWGGATLVGGRTAGNLEYSNLEVLSDGSGVRVSFARVLTGKKREIEGRGFPADIVVPVDSTTLRDFQLERAVRLLIRQLSGHFGRVTGHRGMGIPETQANLRMMWPEKKHPSAGPLRRKEYGYQNGNFSLLYEYRRSGLSSASW